MKAGYEKTGFSEVARYRASLMAQQVKNLPVLQETQVQSLGQEHALEKEMATHSSILAWEVSWKATVQNIARSQTWLSHWAQSLRGWETRNHRAQLLFWYMHIILFHYHREWGMEWGRNSGGLMYFRIFYISWWEGETGDIWFF